MGDWNPFNDIDGDDIRQEGYSDPLSDWLDGKEVADVKEAFVEASMQGSEINAEWANYMQNKYANQYSDDYDPKIGGVVEKMLDKTYYKDGQENGLTTDGVDTEFIDADGVDNPLPGQEEKAPEQEEYNAYFKGIPYDPMRGMDP